MARVISYIALGSNLEGPQQQLLRALRALRQLPHSELVSASSFYRSKAVGPGEQADYLNAVCRLDTELEACELLQGLQQIEHEQGRVRSLRWGPRTLDLDLLLYGVERLELTNLQVPHPHMFERNFVLYPLAEIAPDLLFPTSLGLPKEVALGSLLAQIGDTELTRLETEIKW